MSQERVSVSNEEYEGLSERERSEIKEAVLERHNEELEKRSPEKNIDAAEVSAEALEQARAIETDKQPQGESHEKAKQADRIPGRKARDAAYNNIMDEVRDHLSPTDRAFSKFIHAPAVERVSEVAGSTVARPNAILAGGITAFAISLVMYLVARYYGYPLSGTEAIATFTFGWLLGVIFDFLRVMITGKKA